MAKRARTKAGTSKAARAEKERLFVEAMIVHQGNQTQAAIAAGYKPGQAAEKAGYRLSKDVRVQKALEARRAEVLEQAQERTHISVEDVLQSLARAVKFDPRKLYRKDGSLKGVHELDEDTAQALAGVEVVEMAGGMKVSVPAIGKDGKPDAGAEPVLQHVPMYTKKVKWLDKNAAREQAMKHFGLYEADNRQKPATTVQVGVLSVPAEALNFEKVRARALKHAA